MFITWKYHAMNKSRLWSQNLLRQTCNVFVFTFIKHLFKRRDFLHIGCLAEKVISHIVLIWTIKFNLKQVKPLEVCITWKVTGFLEFYIFPGHKNINMLYQGIFYLFHACDSHTHEAALFKNIFKFLYIFAQISKYIFFFKYIFTLWSIFWKIACMPLLSRTGPVYGAMA